MEPSNNSSIDLIRQTRTRLAAKKQSAQDQNTVDNPEEVHLTDSPSQKSNEADLPETSSPTHDSSPTLTAELQSPVPDRPLTPTQLLCKVYETEQELRTLNRQLYNPPPDYENIPNPIPPAPPLPPPSAFTTRRYTSSSGKTPVTQGTSSDSEGRHTCPHGISYPPLDELLKYGRVSRPQLIEVEKHFDSERFHCVSHMICEGIYNVSADIKTDSPVIEDFVPLKRNDFNSGLKNIVEDHLRSRMTIPNPLSSSQNTRTTKTREYKPRNRPEQTVLNTPPPPSTPPSERSLQSYDYSIELSEQFPPRNTLSRELRFSDETTSPVRQRNFRDITQEEASDPETVKARKGTSKRGFTPTKDHTTNMSLALEACSLPQIFSDVRLTFLHYIHQSLYSLHLRTHVKTQSYPKTDILELLIIGRDLCDQRSRYNSDIRHPQLLKLFLRELFSRRSRKVRSNCFEVPMLREGHTITSSLALEAFTSLHRLYQVEWNKQFGQMVTPPFI